LPTPLQTQQHGNAKTGFTLVPFFTLVEPSQDLRSPQPKLKWYFRSQCV
jgi:hypothetical protein